MNVAHLRQLRDVINALTDDQLHKGRYYDPKTGRYCAVGHAAKLADINANSTSIDTSDKWPSKLAITWLNCNWRQIVHLADTNDHDGRQAVLDLLDEWLTNP